MGERTIIRIILIGLGVSVIYWVFQTAIDWFVFKEGVLVDAIWPRDALHLGMRIIIVLLLMTFTFCVNKVLNKHLRVEKALRESEECLRKFAASTTDVIYRLDPSNNRYDFISPSFQTQTGYTMDEIETDPKGLTRGLTHPDDVGRVFDEVKEHIAKGPASGSVNTEYRVIRKNGDVIWVSDTKDFEFTDDGQISRINGVVRDITELKKAEEVQEKLIAELQGALRRIRQSEEKLSRFMSSATDGFSLFDSDLNLIEVNESALNLTDSRRENVIGKNLMELSPGLKETGRLEPYREVMKTGEPLTLDDVTVHSKYGVIRIAIKAFKVGDGLGIISSDITERIQTQEALKASEEKLKSVIESANDVIFQLSPLGIITYVSPNVKELYGFEVDELVGSHFKKTTPANEVHKVLKSLKEVLSGKVIKNFEITQMDRKGNTLQIEINVTPVRKGGKIIAVQEVMRDITERKLVEREREKLIEELSQALKKIKTLRGLIPICSHCKKVRDDQGFWNQVESFIAEHSEAEFSHSICPECAKTHYPDYYNKKHNDD